jgi:putative endonuclease
MKYYYVYILKCSDNSYYTGITNDVDRRLNEHVLGSHKNSYTFSRRPVVLLYQEYFTDVNEAIAFEKKVKGWSRAKKEALIKDDWDEIVRLSNLKRSSTGSD